jgi:hypothetical protein
MKNLIEALLNAQMEMESASKGSSNPFFKSKYADLNSIREACMPVLNKYGIVVLQPTVVFEGKNYVKTLLFHTSGESMESLTEILYKSVGDAQGQGSGITYARRYGLQSFVNVGAEDDDGNKASQAKKEEAPKQKAPLLATKIDDVNKALKEGKTTMDFLLANYTISNEVMSLLIFPKK